MDKIRIGRFIAECRREMHITQEQLAQMLNVTNKSVSKWETGLCLPDASLFEPLCKILGITIDELFIGKLRPAESTGLLQMLKQKLYALSDKSISFRDFDSSLEAIAEISGKLRCFPNKAAAVSFLQNETSCTLEECEGAYDFYVNLFIPEE